MRRTLLIFLLIAAPALAADPRKMTFPLPQFTPPEAERITLPPGMTLYLLEDHELPLITIFAMIKTGGIYEPPERIGLAGITGSVLRTGGTRSRSGDQLDEELEAIAAIMTSGIGDESGFASLDVLKADFDAVLPLFAEMLIHPRFEEEKIVLAKEQAIEAIRRKNDLPGAIAAREFRKRLFGPDHPYAREATEETVGSITRDDLIDFHRRTYHAGAVMLGVTGDFQRDQMVAKIRGAFAQWGAEPVVLLPVPRVEERPGPLLLLVPKKTTQAQIRIGHLSLKQDDPDFFALSLLDQILGSGGFMSRLFREVRTREGLAYSVGSVLRAGTLDRGYLVAYGETKTEAAPETVTRILDEIKRIRRERVAQEELANARDAFLNSFIFSFSSRAQIVSRRMTLDYYGLPSDFLERYRDNVAKVTADDILRVAQRQLDPERLVILLVGDESLAGPLGSFGPVVRVDLK